jgi:hypothetical protein
MAHFALIPVWSSCPQCEYDQILKLMYLIAKRKKLLKKQISRVAVVMISGKGNQV